MTDQQWNEPDQTEEGVQASADAVPPQYGVGPFSVREVALLGVWVVAFIVSFFPLFGRFGDATSIWGSGIDWVLRIGVPTVAVFLVVLRRFSPDGIRRVGSLGIDQFASVAFSVSATLWLATIWSAFLTLGATGVFVASWVVWVEFIAMVAGVVLTVFAPLIPPLAEDFRERSEVPAHRYARPARPVVAKPQAPARAVVSDPSGSEAHAAESTDAAPATSAYEFPTGPLADLNDTVVSPRLSGATAPAQTMAGSDDEPWTPMHTRGTYEPAPHSEPAAPVQQAFWALSPVEREVLDERGLPIFRVGPTAWALVIEDRGSSFVIRHEDGRIGYLHDVTDVTRG